MAENAAGESTTDPAPGRPALIAHVVHRLDVGGLENGLVNLVNALPQDEFRHAIVCLTDYTDFHRRITVPVELEAMHRRTGQDPGLYFKLWKVFRRLRPDIVHTRNLATLEAQLPALLAGVPHRVHGEHGRDVHDLDNTRRRYRILRQVFRPIVDRYVTVSQELETYLHAAIGVPQGRILRICNGVDSNRFTTEPRRRDVLRGAPFAADGRVIIGTVGRMQSVKDQVTLARAFVKLVQRVPDSRNRVGLVMVGDGPLRYRVEQALHFHSCTDLAWLPGTRDDTPDLLRALDVFVLPSLAEGISNTILEAMASGLPVVATDVGGNSELVAAGETGLLVPRADPEAMATALERYVADESLRAAHGRAARARVEREFALSAMVNRYATLYRELLRR